MPHICKARILGGAFCRKPGEVRKRSDIQSMDWFPVNCPRCLSRLRPAKIRNHEEGLAVREHSARAICYNALVEALRDNIYPISGPCDVCNGVPGSPAIICLSCAFMRTRGLDIARVDAEDALTSAFGVPREWTLDLIAGWDMAPYDMYRFANTIGKNLWRAFWKYSPVTLRGKKPSKR